jgi:diaminohydroxyphosphoribosylaminopyrimidine deaminase / 5-amino-6-(5-phosphoribosylamino)uracil reductase
MEQALELAKKGSRTCSPNPAVGCLIVKEGKVVGRGWHKKAGEAHAEILALEQAGEDARGADVYVTLEPCCHHGRTGPCTKALISAGVERVYVGARDPNPLVSGKGIQELREAGIEVNLDIIKEARRMNEAHEKFVMTGKPFVILKAAASLDGRISLGEDSKWISCEESRHIVHELRDQVDAILVGIGTILSDDPRLTARPVGREGKKIKRVVIDSELRIPNKSNVLGNDGCEAIIFTSNRASQKRIGELQSADVEVIVLDDGKGRVDLNAVLCELGKREVTSLLVEGGAEIFTSFLKKGLADKLVLFLSAKILGSQGKGMFGDLGISGLEDYRIYGLKSEKSGSDIMVEAYLKDVQ